MATISHLFIVGAGFSFNAGLPLAGDFTKAMLDVKNLKLGGPSNDIVKHLSAFVETTFGNGTTAQSEEWPALEDIFTLVDLSANSGHHLGSHYSAAALRTVRRALIVRFIRMLQQCYRKRKNQPDKNWITLEAFLQHLNLKKTAILSLNWDSVIEQGLERTQNVENFDYGCDARAITFAGKKIKLIDKTDSKSFRLLKPHGSINWLYCDTCREIYWLPPSQIERVAQTLFSERDWAEIGKGKKQHTILQPSCPLCRSKALGTRLATFSYRKALDFPMHASTWRRAEALLREAETWVFFGYSMPGADFEFKHLLKRVELSRKEKPHIILVTGGAGAKAAQETYRNFFGSGSIKPYSNGVTSKLLQDLTHLGALSPE